MPESSSREMQLAKTTKDLREDSESTFAAVPILQDDKHGSGPTIKLTGRGEQHPSVKANYRLKNELAALRSNEVLDRVPTNHSDRNMNDLPARLTEDRYGTGLSHEPEMPLTACVRVVNSSKRLLSGVSAALHRIFGLSLLASSVRKFRGVLSNWMNPLPNTNIPSKDGLAILTRSSSVTPMAG